MKIFHICNDYHGSKVHLNLYKALDDLQIPQVIYVPLNYRGRKFLNTNVYKFQIKQSKVLYSSVLGKLHRFFYRNKVKTLIDSISQIDIDFESISIVHATNWCVDGALAYEIYKKYSLPYIVAIRNTDVNYYYKYFFWHRTYFKEILEHAQKIIFISEQYKRQFIKDNIFLINIQNKCITINNGIEKIFFCKSNIKSFKGKPTKLLYVGAIQKNKNLHNVIEAVNSLNNQGYNFTFTVVGRGLSNYQEKSYQKKIDLYSERYKWLDIKDAVSKEELISNVYSKYDIFIMASFYETFGLVYLEALRLGLPVIYTKNQGFDNVFDEGVVGFHTDPYSIRNIAETILKVAQNYKKLQERIKDISFEQFQWNKIGERYVDLYHNILKEKTS